MWLRVVNFLKKIYFEILVPAGAKILNASLSIPEFLSKLILNYIGRKGAEEAESAARLEDQKKIDDQNRQKLIDDILKKAPQDELIKDELDAINGTRKP